MQNLKRSTVQFAFKSVSSINSFPGKWRGKFSPFLPPSQVSPVLCLQRNLPVYLGKVKLNPELLEDHKYAKYRSQSRNGHTLSARQRYSWHSGSGQDSLFPSSKKMTKHLLSKADHDSIQHNRLCHISWLTHLAGYRTADISQPEKNPKAPRFLLQ